MFCVRDVFRQGFQSAACPVVSATTGRYLLRGIGEKCWVHYDFARPEKIFNASNEYLNPIIQTLMGVASSQVMPAVRIPMTASSERSAASVFPVFSFVFGTFS